MTGNLHSNWGIKRSGDDISQDIIGIIDQAEHYIIIGGYNFTFQTVGYSFFNQLFQKAIKGIPILMIIPPHLSGFGNNQPDVINFCINNGIGLILNGNNHSKWILTDKDLYYGSSNFSVTSWKSRIEVITIHNHSLIHTDWKNRTIKDFKDFVREEIKGIRKRQIMQRRRGLILYTRIIWNQIKSLTLRFNPSIEEVITTLNNYDRVKLHLENISGCWFEADLDDYKQIIKINKSILKKVDKLNRFAYNNIFNETAIKLYSEESFNVDLPASTVERYNLIHHDLIEIIEISKKKLINFENKKDFIQENKNLTMLSKIDEILKSEEK